jgi:hypothetical protein
MSFRIFTSNGQDIIINTDRIISILHDQKDGKTVLTCTDQLTYRIDESVDEVKKKIGVRNPNESKVGFRH